MVEPEHGDRRGQSGERRTYNRRQPPAATPPYFQVFERIAIAIERIDAKLEQREVRLPDTEQRPAVAPRTSPEQQRRR